MVEEKEVIYQSVVNCVKDNNLEVLRVKINRLKSIIDYKDAADLLEECYQKEKSVKRKMRAKKVGKTIIAILDFALIVFVAILCIWIIRR